MRTHANTFEQERQAWTADSARMCTLYDARQKALSDSMADLKARFKREMRGKDQEINCVLGKLGEARKQVCRYRNHTLFCLCFETIQTLVGCTPQL